MSKLYEKYLSLKKEDNSTYYLFKSGIFYIFLDNDAKKMSNILNLKLGNLNENVVKCGFPINSLNKYMNLIKSENCNVKIIENSIPKTNLNLMNSNKEFLDFLNRIASINPDNLSIKEVYLFLDNISKQAKSLIIKLKEE